MKFLPMIFLALVGPSALAASCSWDRPGHNPFMGDVVGAVDNYKDIPVVTRNKLKFRMAIRQYDEIVDIRADAILGNSTYSPEIRDMHFGQGKICDTVSRARWTPQMQERGLVYCEDGYCILVPTVCRNVSRIRRIDYKAPAASEELIGGSGAAGGAGSNGNYAINSIPIIDSPEPTVTWPEINTAPVLNSEPTEPPVHFAPLVPYIPSVPIIIDRPYIIPVVPSIPEPSTAILSLLGLAALTYKVSSSKKIRCNKD